MTSRSLQNKIESLWAKSINDGFVDAPHARSLLNNVLEGLDNGKLRVAEKSSSSWRVNQWVKKAILLYLKFADMRLCEGGVGDVCSWDKVPLKCKHWNLQEFQTANFRCAPGSIIRKGAYIGPKAIVMPSFINIGAYIGGGTVVDSWATIGSGAQIGENCHISDSAGIAGVLEPLQSNPVIIEDDCFVGARTEIAEGVIVGKGSVIGMGVHLGSSTKIIDRETGRTSYGYVPPYSVVVPGSVLDKKLSDLNQSVSVSCAIIVKRVDQRTRRRTEINQLLRSW